MSPPTRREFLQTTGAALAAGVLATHATGEVHASASSAAHTGIPPHKPFDLVGLHAYADCVSVPAGETIRVHVSATVPYRMELCRLGTDVDSHDGDEVLESWTEDNPAAQPIHPGSYIHVERGLIDEPLAGLTLELWIRLWDIPGDQAVIGQLDLDGRAGFGLVVRRDGSLGFYLGGGGTFEPGNMHDAPPGSVTRTESSPASVPTETTVANGGRAITWAKWHHVAATFDGREKRIWVDGRVVGEWSIAFVAWPGSAPLRIGALGRDGMADGFLDADIAMPAIWGRALTEAEIAARVESRGLTSPKGDGLLACWPLDEERGERIADTSGNARHGRIVNHATWMIGGPSFNADIDRFGGYEPSQDANRGHGLRLASDDLYDCRWQPTFEYRLPPGAKSGIYAARFRFDKQGSERLYHTLFVVNKPSTRPKAKIAFLCSTNSWRAYAGTPFAETWPGLKQSIGHAYVNSPGDPPATSFYWQHKAGQGTYQMGVNMPWPVVGPYTFHQDLAWECSHLCHADRLTLTWLEREGYDVDVLADLDLHRDPAVLDGYRALFIVGHSEYWSAEAYRAVERYFAAGGSVVCLSGNTAFWRVSFNDDATIVECRKVDAPGAQMAPSQRGEIWHSHDGAKGGMSRECGYPAWKLLGLEYMSIHAVGVEGVGPYRVTRPDHPFFRRPHDLGLAAGDKLGEPSDGGLPELIGHEGDVRVTTLAKFCLKPLPPGAEHPAEDPPGITLLAEGIADWSLLTEGAPWDYFQRPVTAPPERTAADIASEMIYWERADGGRVFHAGSVSAGRGFANDPRFGLLIKNVLHEFGAT